MRRVFELRIKNLLLRQVLKFLLVCIFFKVSTAAAVNIAVIAPKSENVARLGHEFVSGVRIAVDVINQNGGVLGEKINLVEIEDKCNDMSAVSVAQMLSFSRSKAEKIDLVIGPYCSNSFREISETYAMRKIIRIMPLPLIKEQEEIIQPGFFKLGGLMSLEAKAFFEFYKQKFANKNLAMVYNGTLPQTAETAMAVQTLFANNGMSDKITLYDVATYERDNAATAKEILLNNQVVYLLENTENIAKIAQKLQEEKEDVVLFTDEYLATAHFFKEMGNFVEGVYLLSLEDLKDKPEFTEDLVQLRLLGKEPRGLGVYGYAAVKLWQEMAEKANSFDFDKIDKSAKNNSYRLPWGNVRFHQGIATENAGYGVYQIKNGEYTQVD